MTASGKGHGKLDIRKVIKLVGVADVLIGIALMFTGHYFLEQGPVTWLGFIIALLGGVLYAGVRLMEKRKPARKSDQPPGHF